MVRKEKRIGSCSVVKNGVSVQLKYVRGTDGFIGSVICSVYVYTLHMVIGQGCIFMREKENLIRLLRLIIYQSYNELSKYTVRSCDFTLNFGSCDY